MRKSSVLFVVLFLFILFTSPTYASSGFDLGRSSKFSFGDFKQSIRTVLNETKEVKPSQVEILEESSDSRLTIYTCSGFLDSARFVVVGRLVTGS